MKGTLSLRKPNKLLKYSFCRKIVNTIFACLHEHAGVLVVINLMCRTFTLLLLTNLVINNLAKFGIKRCYLSKVIGKKMG
jgi:hypothetical protein